MKSVWARRPRALESLCLHNQGQRLCMSGGPGPLPTGPAPGKQWAHPRSSRRPRRGVPGPRGPHLCLGGRTSPCKAFTTLTESGGRGRGDVLSGLSHSSRSWSETWGPGRTSQPCAAPHPGAGCRLCGCPGRPSRWVSPPRRHAGRRCCMGGLLTLPTRWRGLLCRRPRPGPARPGCSPAAPRAGSHHPPLMDPGSWCRAGFTGLTETQCACWELWALPGCSSGAGAAQLPGMPEAARASRAQQARCWKRPRAQGKGRIRKGGGASDASPWLVAFLLARARPRLLEAQCALCGVELGYPPACLGLPAPTLSSRGRLASRLAAAVPASASDARSSRKPSRTPSSRLSPLPGTSPASCTFPTLLNAG